MIRIRSIGGLGGSAGPLAVLHRSRLRTVGLLVLGASVGTLGLVHATTEGMRQVRLRGTINALTAEVANLQETVAATTEREKVPGAGPFDAALPFGSVPGPILQELLLSLESVGISSYDYRLHAPVPTTPERELAPEPIAPEGAEEADDGLAWADDAWSEEEEDDLWEEGSPAPTSSFDEDDEEGRAAGADGELVLSRWRVDLDLRAPYGAVVELLEALERSPRLWKVSSLEMNSADASLRTRLGITTYSRPVPPGRAPVVDPVGSPERPGPDPFRAIRGSGGASASAPPPLRAVRAGAVPRAWLGSEIVTTGESVQGWTVEVIDEDAVWVRSETGRRVRLTLGG